jgi:hypothetical protein
LVGLYGPGSYDVDGRPDPHFQPGTGRPPGRPRLLANCAIYSTTIDLTDLVNDLVAEGHTVEREDLAVISPYITSRTRRFGHWAMNLTPPPPVPSHLALPSPSTESAGPPGP